VTYSPLLPYYILLFAVLLVWSFAGVEISSYILLSLYTDQTLWFVFSHSMLLVMMPILWIIARIMKRRVSFNSDVEWEYHIQELQYDTYTTMISDYASGYSHLISRQDQKLLIAVLILMATAVIFPAVVVAISISLVFILPFTYGGIQLIYGILLTGYFYRSISNAASAHFHYEDPSRLKHALKLLEATPGFAMVGVRFSMGEANGYFAFRSPSAVGRIQGIEAVARVEITVGDITPPLTAFGNVASSREGEASKRMMELQPGNELSQLEGLVRWCIMTYIEGNGSNEILDDLVEELGIDLLPVDDSVHKID